MFAAVEKWLSSSPLGFSEKDFSKKAFPEKDFLKEARLRDSPLPARIGTETPMAAVLRKVLLSISIVAPWLVAGTTHRTFHRTVKALLTTERLRHNILASTGAYTSNASNIRVKIRDKRNKNVHIIFTLVDIYHHH